MRENHGLKFPFGKLLEPLNSLLLQMMTHHWLHTLIATTIDDLFVGNRNAKVLSIEVAYKLIFDGCLDFLASPVNVT